MIKSSKEFVKYLDNYDKSNQIKYKKRLFNNIQSEYNSIWGVPNTTVFPMNIQPVNTPNSNSSFPIGSIFDNILLPDLNIM